MGLKSVVDDGTSTFLSAQILDFFQANTKIPFNNEVLNSLVRWEAIVDSAFTTMLGGMPSSPFTCEVKCETASMTSFSDTLLKAKP